MENMNVLLKLTRNNKNGNINLVFTKSVRIFTLSEGNDAGRKRK